MSWICIQCLILPHLKNCRSSQGSPGVHFSESSFPRDSSGDLCDVSFASHYCPLKIFSGLLLPTGCPNSLETDKPSKLPGLPNQPCPSLTHTCVQLCPACGYREWIHSAPLCSSTALPFCLGSSLLFVPWCVPLRIQNLLCCGPIAWCPSLYYNLSCCSFACWLVSIPCLLLSSH